MKPTRLLLIGIILVSLLIGLLIAQSFLQPKTHSFLGTHFDDPDAAETFSLTDQDNHPFALTAQRGKIVLLTFGFTHCPDICPTILNDLSEAYKQLTPAEQAQVQIVFISLDPERDTPAVLKDYVPFFDPSFIGLTGSPADIEATAKKYHVFYKKVPTTGDNYNVDHSTHLYLIDPDGNFSTLYDLRDLSRTAEVADDLRAILKEKKSSDSSSN